MYEMRRHNGNMVSLKTIPDECPFCHFKITPDLISGFDSIDNILFIALLRCSNKSCGAGFVANFIRIGINQYNFESIPKYTIQAREWNKNIKDLFPSFVNIYNQSYHAEQLNLIEICGVGYRKAIEYLIKDYLVILFPDRKEEILSLFLGKCIKEFISNDKIKEISQRAVWLGNDETHYIRKWENSDLSDLKKLIEITVHWIEMELLTNEYLKKMPEAK
jgi:hypothetical protein